MKKIPRPFPCVECGEWFYAKEWNLKKTKGKAKIKWKCSGCKRTLETTEDLEHVLIDVKSLPEPKIAFIEP